MNELIKIREENGQQLVSARELYRGLGLARTKWTPWSTKNIRKNEFFAENKDWTEVDLTVYGNKTKDFNISVDFACHLINSAKTIKSDKKIELLNKLGLNDKLDIISKPEIEFKIMLEKILRKWNIPIECQFIINGYRIDFLINGYIAVEFDEPHHMMIKKNDNVRMKKINNFVKNKFNGEFALEWVRINQGKSLEGISQIIDMLIKNEDLIAWNNKTKVTLFNSNSFNL